MALRQITMCALGLMLLVDISWSGATTGANAASHSGSVSMHCSFHSTCTACILRESCSTSLLGHLKITKPVARTLMRLYLTSAHLACLGLRGGGPKAAAARGRQDTSRGSREKRPASTTLAGRGAAKKMRGAKKQANVIPQKAGVQQGKTQHERELKSCSYPKILKMTTTRARWRVRSALWFRKWRSESGRKAFRKPNLLERT